MNDQVDRPSHYQVYPGTEAIDIIRKALTTEEFRGYCKGNILKYRLRAGGKDNLEQDIAKANKYKSFLVTKEWDWGQDAPVTPPPPAAPAPLDCTSCWMRNSLPADTD